MSGARAIEYLAQEWHSILANRGFWYCITAACCMSVVLIHSTTPPAEDRRSAAYWRRPLGSLCDPTSECMALTVKQIQWLEVLLRKAMKTLSRGRSFEDYFSGCGLCSLPESNALKKLACRERLRVPKPTVAVQRSSVPEELGRSA